MDRDRSFNISRWPGVGNHRHTSEVSYYLIKGKREAAMLAIHRFGDNRLSACGNPVIARRRRSTTKF
jgi:hypothetical protein